MQYKVYTIFFVLLILISIPSVDALGVVGKKISPITYQPGEVITNHYKITETERDVDISVGGFMKDYVSIDNLKNKEFDLIIDFTKSPPIAGEHYFTLFVGERMAGGEGIGSKVTVTKRFRVNVYSYDKEISASLNTPSVNEGSLLPYSLGMKSLTYSDIQFVRGEITFLDQNNNSIKKISTGSKSLPSLKEISFSGELDTKGLPAGEYNTFADIIYDGKDKRVFSKFNIGAMEISLKNFTSPVKQGFYEFKINVQNNWAHQLKNVYAKLFIEGKEIGQTPSINLEPWQEGELKSIFNFDLSTGEHQGKIQLFYEGESKEIPLTLIVQKEESDNNLLLTGIILLISLIAILTILIYFKRKNKQ